MRRREKQIHKRRERKSQVALRTEMMDSELREMVSARFSSWSSKGRTAMCMALMTMHPKLRAKDRLAAWRSIMRVFVSHAWRGGGEHTAERGRERHTQTSAHTHIHTHSLSDWQRKKKEDHLIKESHIEADEDGATSHKEALPEEERLAVAGVQDGGTLAELFRAQKLRVEGSNGALLWGKKGEGGHQWWFD